MKIGDIVLCGTKKTVGMVVAFDEDNDPIVYEPDSKIRVAMFRNRVKVVSNENR